MVEERITDGRRIAQFLASEVTGREGALAGLVVEDADRDVEPTADGARAYDVRLSAGDGGEDHVASVHVHPDRVRIDVTRAPDRVLEAAGESGLRARPRASTPPATVVFVESAAETKRAADLIGVAATA